MEEAGFEATRSFTYGRFRVLRTCLAALSIRNIQEQCEPMAEGECYIVRESMSNKLHASQEPRSRSSPD